MKVTVAGGDLRMKTTRTLFQKSGYTVNKDDIKTKGELISEITDSDVVVMPTPYAKNGFLNAPFIDEPIAITEIFKAGNEKTLFFGGMLKETHKNLIDYAENEEFLIKNAILTAEGAIEIAMNELKRSIFGSETLIIGFGRIGSYLSKLLKSLGARTTVASRNEKSRAIAESYMHSVVDTKDLSTVLPSFDLVFNTAPTILLRERELSALKGDCFVIDLASAPGGVDPTIAELLQVKTVHALGIPGKYSPESAGRIIFETVSKRLSERSYAE